MNTFSNNSTLNGWLMPGSGTWLQDPAGFFVDECGDLWVPCFCRCGTGATGAAGSAGEAAAGLPGAIEEAAPQQGTAIEQRVDELLEIVKRLEKLHEGELEANEP